MFLIQKTIFQYHGSPWHLLGLWRQPLFLRELLIQVALVSGFTLGSVLVVQLLYPHSWALPQAHIGGQSFGFRSQDHIARSINELSQKQMQIQAGDQTLKQLPSEVGVTLNATQDAEEVTEYSWRERLTPFSLFLEERDIPTYSISVDEAKARAFLERLKEHDKPPVDASVKVEGTNVEVIEGQNGYIYETEALLPEVKELELTQAMSASIEPQVIEPAIPEQSAASVAAAVSQRIATPLAIDAEGKKLTVDGPTLASWIVLVPDPANKALHITYDRAKIKQTLQQLANQVYVPATTGSLILLDGEATGRAEGADGRALAMDTTIDAVVTASTQNQASVKATVQAVAPASRVTRTYSRTSKGLQALVTYWAQSNGGQYGIALRSMDGNIVAGYNAGRQFTSASIYKLYIAYIVYAKIDTGEFSLSTTTSTGASVGTCIDLMIARSDNPCAIALGNMVGWSANDGALRAKGFGSTTLTSGNHRTTASDAASWLVQLQSGSLVSEGHRSSLLAIMNRQIYRSGIPAGSGVAVANKVGFLDGLNHDAGIVYHPKGSYALVVMSSGSSFSRIADLSRQVAAVMGQ